MLTVRAEGVRNGDLALVGDSYANVIKLDHDKVSLQVFSGTQGVSTTDPVRFLGRPMMVSFSEHLLGRIFDGAGVPRDNGPALTENMIPIGGPSVNPARRIVPKHMIRTGIPMIDLFNTLVESQKLPIFSVSASRTTNCWPGSPCRLKLTSSSWAAWASNTTTTSSSATRWKRAAPWDVR